MISCPQAIRLRARQAAAAKKPKMDVRPSTVIENMAQTKQQETTLSVMRPVPDKATNTGSNSQVRQGQQHGQQQSGETRPTTDHFLHRLSH